MTSDEARRRRMLDAKDDAMILSELEVAHLHNKLDGLHREQKEISDAIAGVRTRLHQSGEARLRKQRRNQ